jgi:predicted DNA-binding transcriptional regulator AlpA
MDNSEIMPLVGGPEIAQMLGITRGRVYQIVHTKGFPDPAHLLAMGRIWRTSEVIEWADRTGRPVVRMPTPPDYLP